VSEFGDVDAKDLVPGTLRGYRAWTMNRYSGKLRSVSMAYTWDPGSHRPAACYYHAQSVVISLAEEVPIWKPAHPAPAARCSCGYYATYDLHNLYAFRSWHQMNISSIVIGTVKAYGSVVLGTIGFRAEYMEIEALARSGSLVAEKAAAYGVPTVPSFEALVDQYPPSNVDELIGAPRELLA
jgi:hypothetical protein